MVTFVLSAIIVTRALLTNINAAEWGDSYRILRASNFIRDFSYPRDEKRPPLFSAFLAIRPGTADPVLWGRLVMFGVSLACLFVFYKLSRKLLLTKKEGVLALVFLFLNPTYLYWSLRIYADIFFSLIILLCFYVFELWREKSQEKKRSLAYLVSLGLLCGLGVLTRFEGYILTLAVSVGIGLVSSGRALNRVKRLFFFVLPTVLLIGPWLIYRNPLTSSYLEEPMGRTYNLRTFLVYLVSYFFILGVIPAFSLVIGHFYKQPQLLLPRLFKATKKYPHIVTFILLESAIILAWPAAIPRLFVPTIPFFVIALVRALRNIETPRFAGIVSLALTAIYAITQNKLRLQFLGPHSAVFTSVCVVSVICTLSIFLNKRWLFILSAIISTTLLSASTIYLHRNIYRTIKEVSQTLSKLPQGNVVHNDTAGIVDWYLPDTEYKNFDNKTYLTFEYLDKNNVRYVVLTNEFNPDMEIDLTKRPYLKIIAESKYNWGGKMFFTWSAKVQK